MSDWTDLADAPLGPMDGVPLGYNGWRFVVRIAKIGNSAVLGNFILGTDVLSALQWVDITNWVRGVQIQRGSTSAGERVGAGKLTLHLDNQANFWAPWQSIYYDSGTLIQVGVYCAGTAYAPTMLLFTGFTSAWNELRKGNSGDKYIALEALETMSLLTLSNKPAVSAIGAGENFIARVNRIIKNAEFPFSAGVHVDLATIKNWTYQATTLAQNALTELFLAGDSLTSSIVPMTNGSVIALDRRLNGVVVSSTLATINTLGVNVPYVGDSVETSRDDKDILTSISLSRAGGSAVNYATSYAIQGRYQDRSTQRFDLVTQDPGSNADLLRYATDQFARKHDTYRVKHVQLDTLHGNAVFEFICSNQQPLDIFRIINIKHRDSASSATGTLFSNYAVCGYTLNISSLNLFSGIRIVADIETEPSTNSTWARY